MVIRLDILARSFPLDNCFGSPTAQRRSLLTLRCFGVHRRQCTEYGGQDSIQLEAYRTADGISTTVDSAIFAQFHAGHYARLCIIRDKDLFGGERGFYAMEITTSCFSCSVPRAVHCTISLTWLSAASCSFLFWHTSTSLKTFLQVFSRKLSDLTQCHTFQTISLKTSRR